MVQAAITCVTAGGATVRSDLWEYLGHDLAEIARADTERWIKSLRLVSYDTRTMRERFHYRQDSLWWFTELYLFRSRRLETAVATVLALEAAWAHHRPAKLILETDDLVVRDATHTFGRVHRVPVESLGAPVERVRHARPSYLTGLTAALSRLRPAQPVFLLTRAIVAAFVYTSPRPQTSGRPAHFVGQVIDAVSARLQSGDLHQIGIGPRRNLRRASRSTGAPIAGGLTPIERFAPPGVLGGALDVWRRRSELAEQVTSGANIRATGEFHGCDLWPILRRELEAAALHQWPWAARAMDEAAAAISAVRPDVVVTYAEASAWGRAIVLEARRRHVTSVGLQHELLGEHGLSHSHEPDELTPLGTDAGFPMPDRTLVFDQQAANYLQDVGHFAASRVVVTGHPRADEMKQVRLARLAPEERAALRQSLGVGADQRLAVLVARELGPWLPAIVQAVAAMPAVHLAVKVHPDPEDSLEAYASLSSAGPNVRLIAETLEISQLLAAADGLVTRESTVAVDALSLGVPSLVIGTPGHLGPLVDAGIMLAAGEPGEMRPALETLLYDDRVRKRLGRVVGVTSSSQQRAVRAADRAADAILELTGPTK